MERLPTSSTAEQKEKKSDPRLKKVLAMVRNTLVAAGVLGLYGTATVFELNRAVEQRDKRESSERKIEREAARLETAEHGGVESIRTSEGVLPAESIQAIKEHGFPKGWFEGVGVAQGEDDESMVGYGMEGNAAAGYLTTGRGGLIEFYPESKRVDPAGIVRILVHESCHAAEHRLSVDNPQQHQELMTALQGRVTQETRFRSPYVESINLKGGGQDFARSVEYFAEVCEEYFEAPENLPVNEFMGMKMLVEASDPNFDLALSRQSRQYYLEQGMQKAKEDARVAIANEGMNP